MVILDVIVLCSDTASSGIVLIVSGSNNSGGSVLVKASLDPPP